MPKTQLTAHFVSSVTLKPSAKKVDYYDTMVTGFMLEVRPTGGATYYLKYRDVHDRLRQFKIGDYKSLTFDKAKQAAKVLRSRVVLGESPMEEKIQRKLVPTLKEFYEQYYLPQIKMYRRNYSSVLSHIRNHILTRFGTKPMSQIRQHEIVAAHQEMREQGYSMVTSNRLVVTMKTMFNMAKRMKIPGCDENPVQGMEIFDPQNGRERYLSKEETKRLLDAVKESKNPQMQNIIELLLFTGARKREIMDAKWEDVHLERRFIRVPLSKSGKPRNIPLSSAAMEVIERLPRFKDCPFLVPNPATLQPYTGVYEVWHRVRKQAGLEDVRLHDLRHTYASHLVNAGASIYVVSKVLGHSQIKNTMRYSHLSEETLLDAVEKTACLKDG